MKSLSVVCFLFILLLSFDIKAQDNCNEVLRLASRNVEIKYSKASVAKYIYESYCSGSSRKSGFEMGVEVSNLIKSVGFSFGSKEENIRHICENYESLYKNNAENFTYKKDVVEDALTLWYQCQELNSNKLVFKPTLLNTMINIDIEKKDDSETILRNIKYNNGISSCECIVNGSKKEIDNKTEPFTLERGLNSITCVRKKDNSQDNLTIYPEAEIIVNTNKGTFSLKIPKDGKPETVWLSEIEAKIENLNNSISELEKIQILGLLQVENKQIIKRVGIIDYNSLTGILSFENPNQIETIALVSDYGPKKEYMTGKTYLREINANNTIKIWETTLDTGDRNNEPKSFTVLIVGFK
jgi:hypothetical protein